MNTEEIILHYLNKIKTLVKAAALDGVVITVEQRSSMPLAMGNYETVVSVRPARGKE